MDLSSEAVNVARSRYPNIKFISGDLYEVALPPGQFEVIVSQRVIDHVEDQPRFVSRVAALLKPKGRLIISFANKYVMDRGGEGVFPKQPNAHIGDYLGIGDMKRLLTPKFQILRKKRLFH